MRREQIGLVAPFVLAIATGTIAVIVLGAESVRHGDAVDYLDAATAIVQGDPYPRDPADLYFFRPPGYPLLVAATWWIIGGSVVAVKLVHVVLFAVTAVLLAVLGSRLTGDWLVGLIAGSAYGVNPFALRYVGDIQTEPLFTFLVAAGVTAAYFATVRGGIGVAVASGVAFGAAALTRPTALAIVVVLAVAVWGLRGGRSGWPHAVAIVAAATIVIVPWTWMNWQATDDPIIVADGLGYHVWIGNHPEVLRLYEGEFATPDDLDRFNYPYLLASLPGEQIRDWEARSIRYDELSIAERDRLWLRAGVERAVDNPGQAMRLWAWKTWGYWRPWLRADYYGSAAAIGSGLGVGALYLLAVVGARMAGRQEDGRAFLVLTVSLVVAATAIHVATHVLLRFRLPYVDPYLTVLAAVPIAAILRRSFVRRARTPKFEQ